MKYLISDNLKECIEDLMSCKSVPELWERANAHIKYCNSLEDSEYYLEVIKNLENKLKNEESLSKKFKEN